MSESHSARFARAAVAQDAQAQSRERGIGADLASRSFDVLQPEFGHHLVGAQVLLVEPRDGA